MMKALLCVLAVLALALTGCSGLEKRPSGSASEYCDGKWVPRDGQWMCQHQVAIAVTASTACGPGLVPVYTGMLWTCMAVAQATWYGYTYQTYPYTGWYYPGLSLNLNACIHCRRRW